MSTEELAGRRLRRGAAAAIAAGGILIPEGYAAMASASCQGPFAYACAEFELLLLIASLAMAGLLGAALVRGWDGAGSLLAGLLVGCVGLGVVYVIALGNSVDGVGTVEIGLICAVPLLVGYGIGRGLARLDTVK
jgi:hypothetical protein